MESSDFLVTNYNFDDNNSLHIHFTQCIVNECNPCRYKNSNKAISLYDISDELVLKMKLLETRQIFFYGGRSGIKFPPTLNIDISTVNFNGQQIKLPLYNINQQDQERIISLVSFIQEKYISLILYNNNDSYGNTIYCPFNTYEKLYENS